MPEAIFHLSFPVTSLEASLAFYEQAFGARRGRSERGWVDVILFGHQITVHERPEQVHGRELRGVGHFGAIIAWDAVAALRRRLDALEPRIEASFVHRDVGLPSEHVKLLVEDPDANLIEIKSYRDIRSVSEAS